MIVKKIFIIFIFFLLLNCGYEPLYSKKQIKKNYNFSIEKIIFLNQNTINQVLKNNLKNYLKKEGKIRTFTLQVDTEINKTVTLKDKKGDNKIFLMESKVDVKIYENEKLINHKKFKEKFEYKNQSSKYDLDLYEKNIKNNLITKISNDIILYLYLIK